MNRINLMILNILPITLVLMVLTLPFSAGAQSFSVADEMSMGKSVVFVNGRIASLSTKTKLMIVKPYKDKKIRIQLADETDFVDFYSLGELEKGLRVKVWYRADGENNRAVKIQKLPELGC